MSISLVEEQLGERATEYSSSGAQYTRVYHVWTSLDESEYSVRTAGGIPERWTAHPEDATAVLERLTVSRDRGTPTLWYVTLNYFQLNTAARTLLHPDPTKREPEIEWSSSELELPFEKEVAEENPKAVLNSAGEKFDPPATREAAYPVLRITRNEWHYSPQKALDYQLTVNSGSFYGAPAGCALMRPWRARYVTEADQTYWQVTYEIWFNLDGGWQPEILDCGFSELDSNGKLVVMKDVNGQPYGTPQQLDGSGKRATEVAGPTYLPFVKYRSSNFSSLKLPAV